MGDNMKKNNDLIFIFIMASIVGVVLVWFPINHLLLHFGYRELKTTDNWVYFEYTKSGFLGKIDDMIESKKTNIQNRVTNYFPFYHDITSLYYKGIIATNKIFYKSDVPIGNNSDGEYVFYDVDNSFYYLVNNHSEDELNRKCNEQIDFFNNLSKSNLNVSLNIYFAPRYEQSNLYKNSLNDFTFKFIDGLNDNINVDYLKYFNVDEYKNYFYKTDHHWSIYGAYQGYKDINNMMNNSSLELDILKVKDNYYGSIAKSSMSKLVSDSIYDVDYHSNISISINGGDLLEKYKPRAISYSKGYDFFDYYVHYFNGQYGLIKYSNDNDNNKNLLIFSDSYGWQIDYLLANNYTNTYVVNLRYDDYQNGTFNYNEFINNNDITDVLFLYEGSAIVYDTYDYNFSGKIVVD